MPIRKIVVVAGCLLFLPAAARAQVASATIAGVVKDTTGAVLPGAFRHIPACRRAECASGADAVFSAAGAPRIAASAPRSVG